MLDYHWDGAEVMRCSYCGQPAMVCNVWSAGRCVERTAVDIVRTAATYPADRTE